MEREPEGRIIEWIERGLTSDDPELAARMDTLNAQFSGSGEDRGGDAAPAKPKRSRRARATLIVVVIALVGLLLTAVLNASSNETPAPPSGLTPAVSL
ncbi:DUF3040 domain-containing protein [Streptomyces gobitricini]|uniref:DUF3040 domain-containing protein n=1 Tax=Streptomyces gobitricini TaxID=68211 RepID=A0ABP5ZEZ1_9ACTN